MVTIQTQVFNAPETAILLLGAGWTSTFLLPLLSKKHISYVATSTTGRDSTLPFKFTFDEKTSSLTDESLEQLKDLPVAETVVVTFPLRGKGQSKALVEGYLSTHPQPHSIEQKATQFIQLGSSGIFSSPAGPTSGSKTHWITRHSPYDTANPRAQAEDELLSLGGCVLNLSGLWGAERQPKNWIDRVAATKEKLAEKASLHLVHGLDVARAVVAVHGAFEKGRGERFILTDTLVYDWWSLILGLSGQLDDENGNDEREKKQIQWVGELMQENGIRALPRSMEILGRCYDSTEFWRLFGIVPARARV